MEKEKLKIGIDIDDVLVDTVPSFISFHNRVYGTNVKFENATEFGMWKIYKITREENRRRFYQFFETDFFENMPLLDGSVEGVNSLSNFFEPIAITSRDDLMREETVQWINNFFKEGFKDVLFTNQFSEEGIIKTKAQICRELKISILIEDRRKYALDCAENGIKVLLLDKPWNQNCEHDNIIRVKDWKEILEKVEGIKKELERKNIIEEIKKFVEEECKKPTSKYGYAPFNEHFIFVVDYAVRLAGQKNADAEVVEISAWLHDIGSIIYGRENHHITGAEIAVKKLRELNYPREKIEKIKKCILNHRGSIGSSCESVEEEILVEADTVSAFENIEGLFECAFVWEKLNRDDASKSVKQKLINKYNQLSPEGKELIRSKYEAAMLLLGD